MADRLASRGWVNSCVKLLRLTLDASTALRGEPSKGCRVDDARLGLAALQQLGQLRKCIVRRSLSDYLNQTWHIPARLNQRVKRSQALCTRIFVSHLATVPTPQSASRWPIANGHSRSPRRLAAAWGSVAARPSAREAGEAGRTVARIGCSASRSITSSWLASMTGVAKWRSKEASSFRLTVSDGSTSAAAATGVRGSTSGTSEPAGCRSADKTAMTVVL